MSITFSESMPEHLRMRFPLVVEDHWPLVDREDLLVARLAEGSDLYTLQEVPVFVRGVSVDDEVAGRIAKQPDGEEVLTFLRVTRHNGRSTVRILLEDEDDVGVVEEVFRPLGCEVIGTRFVGLVALDIPPTVEYEAVRALLVDGQDEGTWDFEEGSVPVDDEEE